MGSGSINEIGIGSFTVYSVDENGNTEFLGTLDGIESIEAVAKEKPEEENDGEMIFSLLEPDEVTFTAKMTLWTRIKLWFWWHKLKIQKWLVYRKFKRSFDRAAKEQEKFERRIHRD
jgi:hypothetical protein